MTPLKSLLKLAAVLLWLYLSFNPKGTLPFP
jgi:hypothetical protein